MPLYTTQVTLFPTSNLVADASTNTWSVDALNLTQLGNFESALVVFYRALTSLYPNIVRQNTHQIKSYNRADPKPRAPVTNSTWNFISAPTGVPLPPEVSLCGSFQAPPFSGVPQARRRGRIYIGPLSSGTLDTLGRPTAGTVTVLRNALEALRVSSAAAADWKWQVFSVKNLTGYTITNGWVDNEFDTQRRRGRLAVSRTVFP